MLTGAAHPSHHENRTMNTIFSWMAVAPSAAAAQAQLRDPATFGWHLIPLLLIVLYLYADQAAQGRWNAVLGALAFWLMDWINEIANGLIFHLTEFAPLWGTPDHSGYTLLIGLNMEISLMFAVMGLYAMRLLPADRRRRVLGVNNRLLLAAGTSVLCVLVEVWLNRIGALTWEWSFWNTRFPVLIFLFGYLTFFLVGYWVHDMESRARQIRTVAVLAAIVAGALALFGGVLGWL